MGVSKSFGTQTTEEPPRQLVRIVFFDRAWDQMAQKRPIFGQKCQFWAKLGQKSIFGGDGVNLLVSSQQETNGTPFLC